MMDAFLYDRFGGPEVQRVGKIPKPGPPGKGDILIKVHAASLNPVDFKQRGGGLRLILRYGWPQLFGFDFSGEIVALGEGAGENDCGGFAVGDEVFGMVNGLRKCTCAEYCVVSADICAKKPKNVTHVEAASVGLVGMTVVQSFGQCFRASTETPGPSPTGPRVLILRGSGGIGTIAIQLAKQMFGARYVAVTASASKTEELQKLGADRVIDYKTQKFEKELASSDEQELFDVILDGTGEASKCVPLIRKGGGIASIEASPDGEALQRWLSCNATSPEGYGHARAGVASFISNPVGSWLIDTLTGASSLKRRCKARGAVFNHVIASGNRSHMHNIGVLMQIGRVKAQVQAVFPLARATEAMTLLEAGRATGKIVIEMPK